MKFTKVALTTLVLILCIIASGFSQNSGTPNLYVQVKVNKCQNPDNVQLWIYNMQNIRTTVMLMAEDGTLLYDTVIEEVPSWGEKLKFVEMPEGTYTFIVDQPGVRIMNDLLFTEKGVEILESLRYTFTFDGKPVAVNL